MTRNRLHGYLAATALAFALPAGAQAQQTILIDLGQSGNETGSNYNNSSGAANFAFPDVASFPNIADLINTAGVSTGYGLRLDGVVPSTTTGLGIGGFNAVPSPNDSGFEDATAADTMFLLNIGNTATFALSDLNPAETYTLEMYNFIGNQGRLLSQWTVGGTSLSLNPQNNTGNTAVFGGVSPDGSGLISIDFDVVDDSSGNFAQGHWNGFRITEDGTGNSAVIDFGQSGNLSSARVNNIADAANVQWADVSDFPAATDLTNAFLQSTGWDFDLVSVAQPISSGGGPINMGIAGFNVPPSPNNSGFEDSAAADSLYLQGRAEATFQITGLPTDGTPFNLDFFGQITADRTLMGVEIDGVLKTLELQNNTDTSISFADLLPDANGVIEFTLSSTADDGGFRQAQLSAIRITEVPEPATAALLALGALALRRRVG